MGIFDKINPFKRKDDLGLPPIESNYGLGTPPMDSHTGLNSDQNLPSPLPHENSQPLQQQPLDDHRMTMPLGENIRQGRVEAMHNQNNPHEHLESSRPHNPLQKDLEIISSKLDYLKASMEAINQRLANLEHLARNEHGKKGW